MASLAGRRIIVTRSAERAGRLSDLVRARGAEVIEVALTETVDAPDGGEALRRALADVDAYQWLILTSPEGARRVREILGERPSATSGPRIAAVGEATADAFGGADLVPEIHTAAALGAALPVGAGRMLFAAALDAGTDVETAAGAKGWTVERVTAYATRARPVDRASVDADLARADAVIFASGSAGRAWVESFGRDVPPVVVAMGPSTARVLGELGIESVIVAGEQSLEGLVDALQNAFK